MTKPRKMYRPHDTGAFKMFRLTHNPNNSYLWLKDETLNYFIKYLPKNMR